MKLTIYIYILLIIFLLKYIKKYYDDFYETGLWINFKNNLIPLKKLNVINYEDILLSSDECKIIRNKVIENKKLWKKNRFIIYSFGGSTYLNDSMNIEDINKSNSYMYSLFPEMYDKILIFMKSILKKEVIYKKDSYLPGFHIFNSYFFRYSLADFHVDKQYTGNYWQSNCDLDSTISFTLAIDLPDDISGMYLFEARDNVSKFEAARMNHSLIKYDIGKIFVHTGNNYHIMKSSIIKKNEYRITLQGHGVYCANVWYLFW